MPTSRFDFVPAAHHGPLQAALRELAALPQLDARELQRVLRRHPKVGSGIFSKSELIRGARYLAQRGETSQDGKSGEDLAALIAKLQKKPVRTLSGVAPVTVLTKPFPCPGRCIFCPNDVRMPKSYLADEPGAQRAASHAFDPYLQTYFRLRTFENIGHPVDKVELIVLGGTWSFYPEEYQIWFVRRCFDALNDWGRRQDPEELLPAAAPDFAGIADKLDGSRLERSYNQVVTAFLREGQAGELASPTEAATWEELAAAQRENEGRQARCVGLVLETRPDHLEPAEVVRLRRLGATKVQIGIQSLSDEVLSHNKRGHDVAATRRAMHLLRQAGFKIHAHWMPNLYGSSVGADLEDFERLFGDPGFRPDELKVYPCSLIESAELMAVHQAGLWRPYDEAELTRVLVGCLERVPAYCRLTRIIRDIPSQDIVAGNKLTNFRQRAEAALEAAGGRCRDVRSREVRARNVAPEELRLEAIEYATSVGQEVFLQFVAGDDALAGFLRLSLPTTPSFIAELGASAVIREVHVYGAMAGIGEPARGRAQHAGLGRRLAAEAARRAKAAGHEKLAVISSVGTREYYRNLGFVDGVLYQHMGL